MGFGINDVTDPIKDAVGQVWNPIQNVAGQAQQQYGKQLGHPMGHLWGDDPWGFARTTGVGLGAAAATFGVAPMAGLIAPAAMGALNSGLYSLYQKRDRALKSRRDYAAMATKNRDLSAAGLNGSTGNVGTAAAGQDVASVMAQYAQQRAQAAQMYENQIMDQIMMFGSMAGQGASMAGGSGNGDIMSLLPLLAG